MLQWDFFGWCVPKPLQQGGIISEQYSFVPVQQGVHSTQARVNSAATGWHTFVQWGFIPVQQDVFTQAHVNSASAG